MHQVGTPHGAQHLAGRCTGLLKFKMTASACCGHQLPTVFGRLCSDLCTMPADLLDLLKVVTDLFQMHVCCLYLGEKV